MWGEWGGTAASDQITTFVPAVANAYIEEMQLFGID